MLGTIERKLTVGFIIAAMVVAVIGAGFYRAAQRIQASDHRVARGHEILEETQGLSAMLRDLESNQHGFFLNGEPGQLQAAQSDAASLPGKVNRLAALVTDNPGLTPRVSELRPAVLAKIDVARRSLDYRQRLGTAALDPRTLGRKPLPRRTRRKSWNPSGPRRKFSSANAATSGRTVSARRFFCRSVWRRWCVRRWRGRTWSFSENCAPAAAWKLNWARRATWR